MKPHSQLNTLLLRKKARYPIVVLAILLSASSAGFSHADSPVYSDTNMPVISALSGTFIQPPNLFPTINMTMAVQEKSNAISTIAMWLRPISWLNTQSHKQPTTEQPCTGDFNSVFPWSQVSRVANAGGYLETINFTLGAAPSANSNACTGPYSIYAMTLTDTANHSITTQWGWIVTLPNIDGWSSNVFSDSSVPVSSLTPVCQPQLNGRQFWAYCATTFNYQSAVANYDPATAQAAAPTPTPTTSPTNLAVVGPVTQSNSVIFSDPLKFAECTISNAKILLGQASGTQQDCGLDPNLQPTPSPSGIADTSTEPLSLWNSTVGLANTFLASPASKVPSLINYVKAVEIDLAYQSSQDFLTKHYANLLPANNRLNADLTLALAKAAPFLKQNVNVTSLLCTNGKKTQIIRNINPKCPPGYKVKK